MIAELLEPAKIVTGLKGNFFETIDSLCQHSTIPGLAERLRHQSMGRDEEHFSYIGDGIAIPHVRVDNLPAPELILGLSPDGIRFNNRIINVVLFLVTPAEQPAQHLQLLQRVCSLLPAIRDEILAQRDPARVLKAVARAEQQSALPTYINLTQEQIAFELQSDLTKGLTTGEAAARLAHYGPNLLRRASQIPWYVKLIRN
ncbi:MAG: PTS sugar transporter subunit IIA, partial [Candidatus Binatia bacterium]